MRLLIEKIKNRSQKINFLKDSKIIFAELSDILYFESVDDKVFDYTLDQALETKLKLYQLEEDYLPQDFLRVNKAVIMSRI